MGLWVGVGARWVSAVGCNGGALDCRRGWMWRWGLCVFPPKSSYSEKVGEWAREMWLGAGELRVLGARDMMTRSINVGRWNISENLLMTIRIQVK